MRKGHEQIGKLQVRNWNKFQHYKERRPPWIKLATDTFQNYEFSKMTGASKLLAICIWTLASRSSDGSVPDDLNYIREQGCLGSFVKQENLLELISMGFITKCAIPEGETETET